MFCDVGVHWIFAQQYLQTSFIIPILLADAKINLQIDEFHTASRESGEQIGTGRMLSDRLVDSSLSIIDGYKQIAE